MWIKRDFCAHCWWRCKFIGGVENSVEVPQKVEIDLENDPTIPLPGIYAREMKSAKDIFVLPCFMQHHSQQT